MPDVPDFVLPASVVADSVGCDQSADLRRIGSHPDHWYPLAWSRELKPGATYATQLRR